MCRAIARRVLVKLAYQGDSDERLFEPIAVHFSREEKACVSGVEIANPGKALAKPEPRDFEVGLIRVLLLTSDPFVVNADLDVSSAKYTKGIICAIEPHKTQPETHKGVSGVGTSQRRRIAQLGRT
jgi:hypothetical protein